MTFVKIKWGFSENQRQMHGSQPGKRHTSLFLESWRHNQNYFPVTEMISMVHWCGRRWACDLGIPASILSGNWWCYGKCLQTWFCHQVFFQGLPGLQIQTPIVSRLVSTSIRSSASETTRIDAFLKSVMLPVAPLHHGFWKGILPGGPRLPASDTITN